MPLGRKGRWIAAKIMAWGGFESPAAGMFAGERNDVPASFLVDITHGRAASCNKVDTPAACALPGR